MTQKPLMLIILDGWGINPDKQNNAIAQAKTPTWNKIIQDYPSTALDASAQAVGLPEKTIGNSEVGHMNIGAGRIVYQDLSRINQAIADKSFFKNSVLLDVAAKVKKSGSALHLMGLLSDGGVHSHLSHLFALLDFAKAQGLSKVFVHCFMDGRDTAPHGGQNYIKKLEEKIGSVGNAAMATVIGRYYAMDRDKRWERTSKTYHAMVCGEGVQAKSALAAIADSYQKGTTDEFILPTVIKKNGKPVGLVQDGDDIIFFNFRADRARQLTLAFNKPDFNFFDRKKTLRLSTYVTMTKYEKNYPYPNIFPPQNLDNVFGEVISKKGLKQFRIAETEKYAHVTYFFNGGQEIEFPGEERALIQSPKEVPTYDLKPEMSAFQVTEEVLKRLGQKKYDCLIMNFANPDMVGHSGRLEPTIKAVETVDTCLGKILDKLSQLGGVAIVTSDHGNSECMADKEGQPHTSHTLNKVPLVLVTPPPVHGQKAHNVGRTGGGVSPEKKKFQLKKSGKLCDITPTMLQLLEIAQPKEMTGESLII
ncbi:MAG: phosphoglycerate mutase (2,3-diphosphoglycerate-independent) [Deltaproteobacteria bacterium RIFCSPLOWO2_01_44_7]|nr:MAG: phosphoglycerate mutase (2,3-diphosphoglycerate-independent) [Deltaproteobacteria bacterium RIFCSPHIGHO2_01_FULL_43_49]OGQ14783.1 MAG: phosphoglycerate mutase (2,3-diphosphoglycerate-independent) [Deltaproteobacteria bacterium RIFCSPHIGHO2_02_FULL_44_53]OGQ28169.1 MAG: phosphoglycerate mutase (2,3-diphosphoglycerate-independent) [Deltaproteobacteria bacterium RIFCSPHIGHO2_12_FULL_44_21]OGQ31381.1 MAG: phosphoglycerate mutase (2,3-diphosphoglycerate-independent) [Deltaproteobacteria bacte